MVSHFAAKKQRALELSSLFNIETAKLKDVIRAVHELTFVLGLALRNRARGGWHAEGLPDGRTQYSEYNHVTHNKHGLPLSPRARGGQTPSLPPARVAPE
jgi:hypothetical protein